jgi:hypothetical protein
MRGSLYDYRTATKRRAAVPSRPKDAHAIRNAIEANLFGERRTGNPGSALREEYQLGALVRRIEELETLLKKVIDVVSELSEKQTVAVEGS